LIAEIRLISRTELWWPLLNRLKMFGRSQNELWPSFR